MYYIYQISVTYHKERDFFNLPETTKMKICEDHRFMGNYLFKEGLIPKACQQYKLALSYYEYCFPEQEEEQTHLDSVRYACLCNISLCYLKMTYYRNALESATIAINSGTIKDTKAYYRRAQAYRYLDEYSAAESDLQFILTQQPNDPTIRRELRALQIQASNASREEELIAKKALGTISPSHSIPALPSNTHEPTHSQITSHSNIYRNDSHTHFSHSTPVSVSETSTLSQSSDTHSLISNNQDYSPLLARTECVTSKASDLQHLILSSPITNMYLPLEPIITTEK